MDVPRHLAPAPAREAQAGDGAREAARAAQAVAGVWPAHASRYPPSMRSSSAPYCTDRRR